jgi:hypothetical protein
MAPKYSPSDDGKTIDGQVVVFVWPPGGSDGPSANEPGKAATPSGHHAAPAGSSSGGAAASETDAGAKSGKKAEAKKGEARKDDKKKREKPEAGKLSNPSWHSESYEHGQKAEMSVEAPWLDGRKVRFIVERHAAGDEWEKVSEATATVSGSRAKAAVEIKADELVNPRCIRDEGGKQALVVDATGVRDGRSVEFTIEAEVNGKWQAQAPVKAVVKHGKAQAPVELHKGKHRFHAEVLPEHAEGNLRFRAELI